MIYKSSKKSSIGHKPIGTGGAVPNSVSYKALPTPVDPASKCQAQGHSLGPLPMCSKVFLGFWMNTDIPKLSGESDLLPNEMVGTISELF